MSKVQVDTIDTRSGTSTMQIGSTNTSTINIGVSGDTVNIPAGVTIANAGTATGFGEQNQPLWFGRKTNASDQTVSRGTKTKITSMTADEIDTHSAYASSRFTVPSGHAGKYFIHGCIYGVFSTPGNDGEEGFAYIYKNGVEKLTSGFNFDPGGKFHAIYANVSGILDLAENDYVELYGKLSDDDNSGNAHVNGGVGTNFGGFKITS